MSIGLDVTTVSVDGELNDQDLDPLFTFISVIADVAEDFVEWYDDAADATKAASEWQSWISEALNDGASLTDEPESERKAFTSWLEQTGFDYTTYFDVISSTGVIRKVNSTYEDDLPGLLNLIGLQVQTVSTNAEQVSLFTRAMVDDYAKGSSEMKNLVDSYRSAGRGHIRP